MVTYKISENEIQRRKRSPFWGIVWALGIILVGLFTAPEEPIYLVALFGIGMGAFIGFISWYLSRDFPKWASNHELLLNKESLIFKNPSSESILDVSAIDKVFVNLKSGNEPVSITLSHDGSKIQLAKYSDMSRLAKDFENALGHQKIEYRRWIHA